jgi:type I restriction enzyme S subunit
MAKVKLGDVAREYKGTIKGNHTLPAVGLEHFTPGELVLEHWDVNADNTFTKGFRKGQVLFGRRRAYLKKAAVAPFDGVCSGDIIVIEADPEKINPKLLPFIIQNDVLFDYAVGHSAGSLSPRVKWEDLREFEFELPELDKQDELVELLRASLKTKKAYQRLVKAADDLVKSQFIEMVGKATSSDKLLNHVDVLYGFPFNSKLFNNNGEGLPLLRIRDINTGLSDTFTTEQADEKYIVSDGDCLVGMDGNFEIVKWNHGSAYLNQRMCKFTPIDIQREYMMYFLRLKLKEIESVANSTTVKHLSAKDINGIEIPIVDDAAQLWFEEFSIQSDKSKFELNQAIADVTELVKSLSQKAFSSDN